MVISGSSGVTAESASSRGLHGAGLRVGEEGYFYVPQKLAYGGSVVGTIPPYSNLLYKIKFVDLN